MQCSKLQIGQTVALFKNGFHSLETAQNPSHSFHKFTIFYYLRSFVVAGSTRWVRHDIVRRKECKMYADCLALADLQPHFKIAEFASRCLLCCCQLYLQLLPRADIPVSSTFIAQNASWRSTSFVCFPAITNSATKHIVGLNTTDKLRSKVLLCKSFQRMVQIVRQIPWTKLQIVIACIRHNFSDAIRAYFCLSPYIF